jgi:hypothetical protein
MSGAESDHSFYDHYDDDYVGGCSDPKHRAALERRLAGAPGWCALERRQEDGGFRDYLDGKPIHCGTGLELQSVEYRSDDYGEYSLKLPTGVCVRYELAWGPGERAVMLHGDLGGHEFVAKHKLWMLFRWPQRGGR